MVTTDDGTPEFFATPGYGDKAREQLHYSQALRIGRRVEISGQGGWNDDLQLADGREDEIVQAFDNVERTLATAGATWRDVVHVNSYHVPDGDVIGAEDTQLMVAQLRLRMGDRAPIWTQTGVPALGLAGMNVEIRVVAIIQEDAG